MSDANLPGDPESPQKTEPIEVWSFVAAGGVSASYTIRPERNEKAEILINAIDQSPLEVRLVFRDDATNAVTGGLNFVIANLVSYGKTMARQVVYAKGESPAEKEVARLADVATKRAEAFERKQAADEAAFQREMAEAAE